MTSPTVETAPRSDAAKPAPVASTRGRKPGIPAKERADIPSSDMILLPLTGKAKADRRRKREDRKPQQKGVDQVVFGVFEINESQGFANGTIADWPDLFAYDWAVTANHAESAEFMINKACRYYHRKPIWGERLEIEAGKSHMVENPEDPEAEIPCPLNGKKHVHIPFSVVRRPARRRPTE